MSDTAWAPGGARGGAHEEAEEVLRFWFSELTPEDWFKTSAETDERIRSRFLDLHERMAGGVPPIAMEEARPALAATIVYDQFPRNMFRGTAAAFATDMLALTVVRNALDKRLDDSLSTDERVFLYMPFMHSEVVADQERCVMLFAALGRQNNLDFARDHRDIVARFGRFPHRNEALGRESTREERAFLEGHEGFGQ